MVIPQTGCVFPQQSASASTEGGFEGSILTNIERARHLDPEFAKTLFKVMRSESVSHFSFSSQSFNHSWIEMKFDPQEDQRFALRYT